MKYKTGEQLKKYRRIKDLRQADVAKAIGVPPSTYANWEQGTSRPSADQLVEICRVLDVSADAMLALEVPAVSDQAMRVAAAFDRADQKSKDLVLVALREYMTAAEKNHELFG